MLIGFPSEKFRQTIRGNRNEQISVASLIDTMYSPLHGVAQEV